MEFRIASIAKAHSAWSAILAFKNIAYLHESDYHGVGDRNYVKLLTTRDILYSIVHHTNEAPRDIALNRYQFLLLFIDDIEEVVRYSKGGRARGLASDHCEIEWEIEETGAKISLNFEKLGGNAKTKYEEMADKYQFISSRQPSESKYDIEVVFVGNGFTKSLVLPLVFDKP